MEGGEGEGGEYVGVMDIGVADGQQVRLREAARDTCGKLRAHFLVKMCHVSRTMRTSRLL